MNTAIIVGGGIGGLVSSISLRRVGIRSRILEAGAGIAANTFTYTGLWDPALQALSKLGIYYDLHGHLQSVGKSGIRCDDGRWLMQPSNELRCHPDHPSLSFIRDDILIAVLRKHVEDPVEFNCKVSRVFRDGPEVVAECSDGSQFRADFLVAADGANSTVRRSTQDQISETLPVLSSGYRVFRGHSSLTSPLTEAFQTWGLGLRFAAVPTKTGAAWFATLSQNRQLDQLALSHISGCPSTHLSEHGVDGGGVSPDGTLEALVKLFQGWHDPIGQLLVATDTYKTSDGSRHRAVVSVDACEGKLGYKGWETILRTDNGTPVPTPVQPSPGAPHAAVAGRVLLSERLSEAIHNLQTAPLAVYVGDAACLLDPILAQGAGVAIETAWGLGRVLAHSGAVGTPSFGEAGNDSGEEGGWGHKIPSGSQGTTVDSREVLQTHLMDFTTNRFQRYDRLRQLSRLSNTLGSIDTQMGNSIRNRILLNTPSFVKGQLVDYCIERSLY